MDTRFTSYGFLFHFAVVKLHIMAKKSALNNALNGYNCNFGDVAFEIDNISKLECAALCDVSISCLGVFYKPETSQCAGCKVWYTTSEKPSRTWSGSLCYEIQVCTNGGDIKRGRSCYFAAPGGLTFDEATTYCEEHDAHLVQAETSDENTFIKTYFQSLSYPESYTWQGLTDIRIEGTWEWYSTGDPVEFQDWDDGEPNGFTSENCGEFSIKRRDGKWNDATCTITDSFTLCETITSHSFI